MASITSQHLEAAIIDQMVAGQFQDKVYAFTATLNDKDNFILGVVVANEHGYSPVVGKTFKTYEEAKRWANELNAHIGRSQDEVLEIVTSSMGGARIITR